MLDGAKLAAKYINDHGGIAQGPLKGATLAIESADDQDSTTAETTIAQRYVSSNNIWALTGFLTSAVAEVAGKVAERAKLAVFSSFACADFLTTAVHNVIIVCGSGEQAGASAAAFIHDQFPKASRIALLENADYSFMPSYDKGMISDAKAKGLQIVADEKYPSTTVDFSSILTKIQGKQPDIIALSDFDAIDGTIAKQARANGIKQPLVDYIAAGLCTTFAKTAGSAAVGFYGGTPGYSFPPTGSFAATIAPLWKAEYGNAENKPQMPGTALAGFDSILTIAKTIAAGAKNRNDLLKYVGKVSGNGVMGPLKYDSTLRRASEIFQYTKFTGASCDQQNLVATYLSNGSQVTLQK